jgi:threonine-phosphate decarboxylase
MTECHGGNIYLLAACLGIAENGIIDFSASINPLGVPVSVRSAIKENLECLFNYPDPDAKRLRLKIAEHVGIDAESIVCGNGSTELIYLITRALRPMNVLIPAPTFSEYDRACTRSRGVNIAWHELKKESCFDIDPETLMRAMAGENSLCAPCDMVFLCNPNNPTGMLIKRDDMLRIAGAAARFKCMLIVDEAFIDFCADASVIDEVKNNPYLVVLRSLTKIYALSGLRIGYAVLPSSLLDTVKEAKEPWTVNSLAQVAGITALDDAAYKTETFRVIEEEKQNLEAGFARLGITYFPSSANYYLLQLEKAQAIVSCLRGKGILVRDCSNFPGLDGTYIRVAVKSKKDNIRLLTEITACGV